jgi:hypothetical protein
MAKRLSVQKSESPFAGLLKIQEMPESASAASTPSHADRKRGKSVDPNFVKLTSYIRKDTHLQVKKRLLDQGMEISELVEELLGKWLAG